MKILSISSSLDTYVTIPQLTSTTSILEQTFYGPAFKRFLLELLSESSLGTLLSWQKKTLSDSAQDLLKKQWNNCLYCYLRE